MKTIDLRKADAMVIRDWEWVYIERMAKRAGFEITPAMARDCGKVAMDVQEGVFTPATGGYDWRVSATIENEGKQVALTAVRQVSYTNQEGRDKTREEGMRMAAVGMVFRAWKEMAEKGWAVPKG